MNERKKQEKKGEKEREEVKEREKRERERRKMRNERNGRERKWILRGMKMFSFRLISIIERQKNLRERS